MRGLMTLFSSERGMIGRAVLFSIGLVAFTLAAGQGLVALLTFAIPPPNTATYCN